MNKKLMAGVLSCAAALAIGAGCAGATAQEAEQAFFKGKTVKIIVGYAPGGSHDIYARMMAPYLKKLLNANVVIENQPGAGGMMALDALYAAPPDGLQMILVDGPAASMEQLVGESGVRYDLSKVGYLGLISPSPYVWLVAPGSPIKTPSDAIKAGSEMSWAAGGPLDGQSDGAAFTCEALRLKCKIVMGYPGSNQAALAVSRGEMDAVYVSDTAANSYVEAGFSRAVATMNRSRSPFFPNLPTIFEALSLAPDQQWWFDFRSNVDDLGRFLIVPPGMPKARLSFLQQAIKKVLTDPALVADGKKTQRYIEYQDPDTTRKMVLNVVESVTAEQKQRIRQATTKNQ